MEGTILFENFRKVNKHKIELTQCVALSFIPKEDEISKILIHLHPSELCCIEEVIKHYTLLVRGHAKINADKNILSDNYYVGVHGGADFFIQGKKINGAQAREMFLMPFLDNYLGHRKYYRDFESLEDIYNKGEEVPKRIITSYKNGFLIRKIYSNRDLEEKVYLNKSLFEKYFNSYSKYK